MLVSLLGYMGSGKSFIAAKLAEQTGRELIDLDREIVSQCRMSIPEIFEKKGEIFFRKKERECLEVLLATKNRAVLSLGGGTPAYYNNMEIINHNSFSVYLSATVPLLVERLQKNKAKRPMIARISDEDLPEFIAKHLFERLPFYSRARYTVLINDKSAEQIVNEISEKLEG